MSLAVRPARVQDADAVAHLRVETWHAAYRGLVPDEVLARLDAASEAVRRVERWAQTHVDPRTCDLVAEVDGEVVGWACAGPVPTDGPGDPADPALGRLHALYVHAEHWGTGTGHALIEAATVGLRSAGFARAELLVLEGNDRAARFYERHGWHEDGVTLEDTRFLPGHVLHERRRVRAL